MVGAGLFAVASACAGRPGGPPPAQLGSREPAPAATLATSTAASVASSSPVTESPPRLAIDFVAAGANHACAIDRTGEVLCWGDNDARQLGIDCGSACVTPVRVTLEAPAVALELTATSSCALLRDRSVACWGDRKSVARTGGSPAKRLVGGAPGACRLDEQGALSCGGNNHLGRLGFPANETDPPWLQRPARVPVPEPVNGAFIAYQLGCAATASQNLFCWGSPLDCAGPVRIELPGRVRELTGNEGALCVLTTRGEVFAASEYREPAGAGCQDFPFVLEGPLATGARAVACHASPQSGCSDCAGCVIRDDRSVACWHGSTSGQGALPKLEPVAGLAGATQVSVGRGFACALTGAGKLLCWGDNRLGQLGRGATTEGAAPAEPAFP